MSEEPSCAIADIDRLASEIQAGAAATVLLAANAQEPDRQSELSAAVRRGDAARDELVRLCEPMVRRCAARERTRRRAWGSAVSFDDLVQDGMVGLLKGIHRYRPGRTTRDPFAYLALWVIRDMRRAADKADQDWTVSTEMVEKFRRIRAVRARLHDSLGRPPTSEEILAGASDPRYCRVGAFARRHRRTDQTAHHATGSGRRRWATLTARDVELEARHCARIGAGRRLGSAPEHRQGDTYGQQYHLVDRSMRPPDDVAVVDDRFAADALHGLVAECLTDAGAPSIVQTVVDLAYGFGGAPPQSARDISRTLNVSRAAVDDAMTWFLDTMRQPNGVLYDAVAHLDPVDRETLGLHRLPAPPTDEADTPADVLHREWVNKRLGTHRIPDTWTARLPAFAGFADLDDLLRQSLDGHLARAVLPALTELAAGDGLAARTLLLVLLPRLPIGARRQRRTRS